MHLFRSLVSALVAAALVTAKLTSEVLNTNELSIRDATAGMLQTNLTNVNADISRLTRSASTVTGSKGGITNVIKAGNKLVSDIGSATKTSTNIRTIDIGQCYSLIDYLSNTIHPNEEKAVAALIKQKKYFSRAKATSMIKDMLVDVRDEFNSFFEEFCNHLCSQTVCYTAKDTIYADWNKGVEAFA